MDLGDPVSYLVLAEGVPVMSSDGQQIGTVEHVLAVPEADVFDGVIVDTGDGHCFADAGFEVVPCTSPAEAYRARRPRSRDVAVAAPRRLRARGVPAPRRPVPGLRV